MTTASERLAVRARPHGSGLFWDAWKDLLGIGCVAFLGIMLIVFSNQGGTTCVDGACSSGGGEVAFGVVLLVVAGIWALVFLGRLAVRSGQK